MSITPLLQPQEMLGRGRLSRIEVPAGSSIGFRRHDGETIEAGPGDRVSVDNHSNHALTSTGDESLEFIALVLFADDH